MEQLGIEKDRRLRPSLRQILFGIYILLAVLFLIEAALRLASRREGAHDTVFGLKLLPFSAALPGQEEMIEGGDREWTYYAPDPRLGWSIKPRGVSRDGLFHSDAFGLRCEPGRTETAVAPDRHRVLLIGDSYTHGDQVPFEATWGRYLQQMLGDAYQVFNAGAGGYGMDQAILRWRELRDTLRPSTVVLGIYGEDLWRNLTFFRTLKHPWTSFPFSKPRFVLRNGDLDLMNQPAIPPALVFQTLRSYGTHPLSAEDLLYFPEFYEEQALDASILARWIRSRRFYSRRHDYMQRLIGPGGEGTRLAAALVRMFIGEVRASGARAAILLIPGAEDLERAGGSGSRETPGRLRGLARALSGDGIAFLDPAADLLRLAESGGEGLAGLYVDGTGHTTGTANRAIAAALERALVP